MRALVLGAAGQLGLDLMRVLPDPVGLNRVELSVTDPGGLDAALERSRAEIVFNCAAYNAVDAAETEAEQAFNVNSDGAFNAAAACRRAGIRLVHFSTNFVFDGSLDRPYVESDEPRPRGAYARSKLEGEQRVLSELPSALVVRTAALFGDAGSAIKGGSFPERVVARAMRGEPLRVVSDQLVNPTYTQDLAHSVVDPSVATMTGVVHLVAEGCCSWDEFARAALAECGVDARVESVTSEALAGAAPRPRNGCLGSTRVSALRPWKFGLRDWAARKAQGGGARST